MKQIIGGLAVFALALAAAVGFFDGLAKQADHNHLSMSVSRMVARR